MKDLFDWDGEDGDERFPRDDDWPDDGYDPDAEDEYDGYDGFYSHNNMEEDYGEVYPEDDA